MDKRTFLKSLFIGSAGIIAIGLGSSLKAARYRKKWDGVFRMPELPYSTGSLEPFANKATMQAHYNNHFSEYTKQLNHAVALAGLTGVTAHDLLKNSSHYPAGIVNLSGGFMNHKLFWRILTPERNKKPSDQLISAINKSFGSTEGMKQEFLEKSIRLSDQGWIWLIACNDGNLKITSTTQNENPLMDVASEKGFPILCLDMWDHSGCHTNGRNCHDYVNSFWNVVNWEVVSKRYLLAGKQ